MEKQGGIYARYSPGRDRDQTSTIESHVAMCREKQEAEAQTNPSQKSPILTPSKTSSSKYLMLLKHKKPP